MAKTRKELPRFKRRKSQLKTMKLRQSNAKVLTKLEN